MRIIILVFVILGVLGAGWLAFKGDLVSSDDTAIAEAYGDWKIECATDNAGSNHCVMSQRVIDGNNQLQLVHMEIEPGAPTAGARIQITVPLGAWLEPGVAIRAGKGSEPLSFTFAKCMPDGCLADGVINPTMISSLKNEQESVLLVADKSKKVIGVPFSLNGFSEAYTALALHQEDGAASVDRVRNVVKSVLRKGSSDEE